METGASRADRDAENLGNLGRFSTLVVAQREQDSLLRCKAAEAPLELIPVGHVQVLVSGGRDVDRQDAEIGDTTTVAHRLGETGTDDEAMEPGVESVRIAES